MRSPPAGRPPGPRWGTPRWPPATRARRRRWRGSAIDARSRGSSLEEGLDPSRQGDAPPDRILKRQAEVGQVEVLDAQPAPVAEAVESVDDGGEVDVARLIGMDLRDAAPGLAQLHVVGQIE